MSGIFKVERLSEGDSIKLILRRQTKVTELESELSKNKKSNTPRSLGRYLKSKKKLTFCKPKRSSKRSTTKKDIETANKQQIDKHRRINLHNYIGCDVRSLENKVKKFKVAAIPEIVISQIVKSEVDKKDSIERLIGILI